MERKRQYTSDDEDQEQSTTRNPKRRWKKPKDKPKRPLSAYNLFFQYERNMVVKGDVAEAQNSADEHSTKSISEKSGKHYPKPHGKIGFRSLTKRVASKWKNLEPEKKKFFEERAQIETERYRRELAIWNDGKSKQIANAAGQAGDSLPDRSTLDFSDAVRWDYSAPPANSMEEFMRRSGRVSISETASSSASLPVSSDSDDFGHAAILNSSKHPAALTSPDQDVLSVVQSGSAYLGNIPRVHEVLNSDATLPNLSDPNGRVPQATVAQALVLQNETKEGDQTTLRRQHVAGLYSHLGDLSANMDDESFELLTDLFRPS